MAKKLLVVLMIVISVVFLVYGGRYAKKSGIFEPYPEAEFLSDADSGVRPVYQMLDETEKAVYSALYNGVAAKKTEIPLPYEITGDVYSKIYCIFEKQEGKFFYIDSTYYTAEKIRNAQIVFRENAGSVDTKISELENAVQSAVANVPDSDYEKALYIHDYIAGICDYNSTGDEHVSTAYGCLVEKKANCEGYAKAFSYLAEKMNMECVLVTGKTDKGENHAWNQVKIDGDWYNLDVTWDDRGDTSDIRWIYFLCNDEDFNRTHIAENTCFKPFECSSTENNYYIKNGFFAADNSEADMIIRREIFSGKNKIDLKFANLKAYSDFKREYIEQQKIFDIILESGSYSDGQMAVSLHETEEECCITLIFS